ncbi:MAG: chemotaxis protein CheW [Chloroflexota bacterium]
MMDLAAPTAAEAQTLVQHVIFTLGNIRCAVPAVNIREVGEISYITPVPNVPDWLVGITSLRGDILSLVDLSTFLDLSSDKDMSLGVSDIEIMVVQSQQETLTAITTGLIVDEVDDIQDIPMEQVRVPTAALDNQLGTYMRGVYEDNGQMVVVLDLERLLMSPEMWQFEAI